MEEKIGSTSVYEQLCTYPSPNPITTLGRGKCTVVQILRLIGKMPQKKGLAKRREYTN